MARQLSPEQLRARATAYEEAAGHLELAWTDDPKEREEGDRLTRMWHTESERLRSIANARDFGNPLLAAIGKKGKP